MRTWQDGVGNVHGRIDGRDRDAPALLCGSHYDTVMDAGKYDGALGIIVAIASVKATILQVYSSHPHFYARQNGFGHTFCTGSVGREQHSLPEVK